MYMNCIKLVKNQKMICLISILLQWSQSLQFRNVLGGLYKINMVVGEDAEEEMVNGDVTMTTSDGDRVRRQDVITVTGKQEDCEAACNALRVGWINSSNTCWSWPGFVVDVRRRKLICCVCV